MWNMIPSLQPIVEVLAPAFTQPSFRTNCKLLLAWVLCLGRHTLFRVGHGVDPRTLPDHNQRHGLDTYYNFFERSSWTPGELARHVCVMVFTRLKLSGRITLLVDDTLIHKRGSLVWGLGWFRDAVASTKKRVATAGGNNWVVLAVAVRLPMCNGKYLAFPLMGRLRQKGKKGKKGSSCGQLVRQMLAELTDWYPTKTFTLVGDSAYSCKELLRGLDERVTYVGRLRGDAALYDPRVPEAPKGKRGRKAKKGPRVPCPKDAAKKADRSRSKFSAWVWRTVALVLYGKKHRVQLLTYEVVWPSVCGDRPIRVVVSRDLDGEMDDTYLFTTDVSASAEWVVLEFSIRWSVEVLFRSSKQVLDIGGPCHWSRESVEKVGPWVWSMQSVIMVWYVTEGYESTEGKELRSRLGEWDSEWSLRTMLKVLVRATLNATINPNSAEESELREMVETLKNCVENAL